MFPEANGDRHLVKHLGSGESLEQERTVTASISMRCVLFHVDIRKLARIKGDTGATLRPKAGYVKERTLAPSPRRLSASHSRGHIEQNSFLKEENTVTVS